MPTESKLSFPPLETRRLRLATLRPREAPAVYAAIEESRVQLRRWLPFTEVTHGPEDTRAFILRTRRSRAGQVWGIWEPAASDAAHRRAGSVYCGNIGLHNISVENGVATLGYWMRTACAGRGYVTEACAAVLLWAFDALGLERLSVEAATGNRGSLRVIEKLGFVHEGLLRRAQTIPSRRKRLDWCIFSLIRSDLRRVRPRLRQICGNGRPWEISP